jgi:hypothetical protein
VTEDAPNTVDLYHCALRKSKHEAAMSSPNRNFSGCFLIHDYQLAATMTSTDSEDMEAAARSKLTIGKMITMMVDILRSFPMQHLPELSPSALYCPYLAAKHSLQLDRINGIRAQPTLGGNDFELLMNALRHFSSMWKCTAEYMKDIERGQARALPSPLPMH